MTKERIISLIPLEEGCRLRSLVRKLDGREVDGYRVNVKVTIETHFPNGDMMSFSLNDFMKASSEFVKRHNERVWGLDTTNAVDQKTIKEKALEGETK